jgi:hypothetical protein
LLDGAEFADMVDEGATVLRTTILRTVLFLGIAVAALLLSHAGTPLDSETRVQPQAQLGMR